MCGKKKYIVHGCIESSQDEMKPFHVEIQKDKIPLLNVELVEIKLFYELFHGGIKADR